MNEIIGYYIKTLSNRTLSLRIKGILVDKPWAIIDNDGEIQKFIFKRDNKLILSKNGKAKEGHWDYFPEAMALLIDRIDDKLLLTEQFIDDNVLILKMDGTKNDFFALANENTIPDYNVLRYLNFLRCQEFRIREIKLYNGKIIQFVYALDSSPDHVSTFLRKSVWERDDSFNISDLDDGFYVTKNKSRTFYVENGWVYKVTKNITKQLVDGNELQIENGAYSSPRKNRNKKVTINGKEVIDSRILDKENYIYEIKESQIIKILVVVEYFLMNGMSIKIEQKKYRNISKGDKIVDAKPIFPLQDGEYRIKGKLRKIKIKDSIIQ